jgi:hypothetical protein
MARVNRNFPLPACGRHSSRSKIPVDPHRPAVADGLPARPHGAASNTQERRSTMVKTRTAQQAPQLARRKSYSLEEAALLCPNSAQMDKIAAAYALDPTDPTAIRSGVEDSVSSIANLLGPDLGERGLEIFMQRLVGAFVASAAGSGQVYSNAVSEAQRLSNSNLNNDRDIDHGGPAGFDDHATRKCDYAAQRAMQAHAALAAAQGAVKAYAEVCGTPWKPFVPETSGQASVARQAVTAKLDALK